MVKYVAYNRMYEKGKQKGKPYIVATGTNKEELKKKVKKYNSSWNSSVGTGILKAKLSSIRRSK